MNGINADIFNKFADLKSFLQSDPPQNYYSGHRTDLPALPDSILMFFRRKRSQLDQRQPNSHHRCLLLCCLDGEGGVVINNRLVYLTTGHVLLIPPHHFHCYTQFPVDELLWLFITFELPPRHPWLSNGGIPQPLDRRMEALLDLIISGYQGADGRETDRISLRLLLGDLLSRYTVLAPREAPSPGHHDRFIEKIAAYMADHLAEPLSLRSLADHIHLSVSHMRNLFQQRLEMGPITYLRQCRMHHACGLLRQTDLSVGEVAARCGFDSLYSFSRAFKRYFRQSPSQYRRSLSEHPRGSPSAYAIDK